MYENYLWALLSMLLKFAKLRWSPVAITDGICRYDLLPMNKVPACAPPSPPCLVGALQCPTEERSAQAGHSVQAAISGQQRIGKRELQQS
eukprot:1152455-Pelagomonas_calceolata.AAC.5